MDKASNDRPSRAGRQVLHQHVGRLHDQSLQHLLRLRMLHVQVQAFLGTVGPDEVRGQAAQPAVVAAREVAHAGALHFDDPRTEISELACGERRSNRMFQRDERA